MSLPVTSYFKPSSPFYAPIFCTSLKASPLLHSLLQPTCVSRYPLPLPSRRRFLPLSKRLTALALVLGLAFFSSLSLLTDSEARIGDFTSPVDSASWVQEILGRRGDELESICRRENLKFDHGGLGGHHRHSLCSQTCL